MMGNAHKLWTFKSLNVWQDARYGAPGSTAEIGILMGPNGLR